MWKEDFIMTKIFIIEKGQKFTEEQLKQVEEDKKYSFIFDEYFQELSPAMKAFKSAVVQRNHNKKI